MFNFSQYIAHVRKDREQWIVHDLAEHLQEVANKSENFAKGFWGGDWARTSALWHDLGKFLPDWQKYIRGQTGYDDQAWLEDYQGRPNHSSAGAVFAMQRFKRSPPGKILAYIIAGHHAGLPDGSPENAGGDLQTRLFNTLSGELKSEDIEKIKQNEIANEYLGASLPRSYPLQCGDQQSAQESIEHLHLWVRMLFSCLVDADFLDTEEFMSAGQSRQRGKHETILELSKIFDSYMKKILASAPATEINRARSEVLSSCSTRAGMAPGFYSLTVPTGGGKTLSSMAFALRHAIKHDKKRVILAIPYTSIIEQTAEIYRDIFGDNVLEHHSNIDPDQESAKNRLASENWDAPIIVTTNVQLFESLFASRTSSCRKLHNIVNSVIILDEPQILPPEYLQPLLSVLRGLVEHFGVTVVLCTATQPALSGRIGTGDAVFEGLPKSTEIVNFNSTMLDVFKRCEIQMHDIGIPKEWVQIAQELAQYEQVLCIVNTRRDCQELHRLMPEGTFHLSANMCGEERSLVIKEIKGRLSDGEVVRVISTQLIEAGVDIDFPVVYRALAGIDSIAQAAGRCNREGHLSKCGRIGKVFVFSPPKPAPVGLLRKGEDAAKDILSENRSIELSDELYGRYFRKFYKSVNNFDKPNFKKRLVDGAQDAVFQFRTFAQEMKLIDDTAQRSIVVYYSTQERSSVQLIEQLRKNGPESWLLRKLQRFIVNVPLPVFERLASESHIEDIHGYWVQKSTGLYQPGYGLLPDPQTWAQELFIVG